MWRKCAAESGVERDAEFEMNSEYKDAIYKPLVSVINTIRRLIVLRTKGVLPPKS